METFSSSYPYKLYRITVSEADAAIRIDKFLSDALQVSRNKIQEAIAHQCIAVNNKAILKANYLVQPQDTITASIFFPPHLDSLIPEDKALDIVYEDEDLLVVHKPARMVTHPDKTHQTGTLANALLHYYKHFPLKDQLPTRPGLVHRLDKGTSGLLVVAKSSASLLALEKQFYDHKVVRTYYALIWGNPKEDKGSIGVPLIKSSYKCQVAVNSPMVGKGKHAVTHYQVIERFHHVALVKCTLETGRTHQIRVHMQHIGHPLFGDPYYGGTRIVSGQQYASYKAFVHNCFKLMPHQALHAAVLGFTHPIKHSFLSFEAALPENFAKLIEKWKKYVAAAIGHHAK
ncbi:RluA family pseudouridine synthase [Candidatus Cardinium hertigii]|uniref:Pseudouridine synthase n=1 Tax=Candidatus Cardinium hertigii TaxID=247481 RepID=A0A2Z3L7Q1_9BACT|nr:RluA family pseudouridine synthase [Candidatus Cardinium hertigii]AWN81491.1 Ribosomal large subunit pseudouridine synthase D [Candidatus Cardinium hertigii]